MANRTSKDIQIKDLDNWRRGQISYFSKGRMAEDALKAAINVTYDYNGVVRPRGSFLESGIPDLPDGWTPLGKDYAFKRADGSEGLCGVFTDGTDARFFVLAPDQQSWDMKSMVFDKDSQVSMAQIDDKVVVGNGVNKFTYYDIKTDDMLRLAKVDDPTDTPVATKNNFSGTDNYDFYYAVAFNGVGGSTEISPAVKVTSSTLRDDWANSNRSVSLDISGFTIDPNAKSWNVYVAQVPKNTGAPVVDEYFKIEEGIEISQKTFIDTGEKKILEPAPIENSTEGITAWYFTNISGRLWAIGEDLSTIFWGGDEKSPLYFGTTYGSDSYVLNTGGGEQPMAVTLGRDNAGTTCINLLTRTMAGQGAIWDVYATTNRSRLGDQDFEMGAYQFKKREGNDGTDAPFSVIHQNNNAYYLSMEGFKSTGVKPNVSGIQATDIISSAIRDRVLNLDQDNLRNVHAAYYDETLFWTIAYGSEKNNEIWVYDILHGGIWSIWRIEADSIFRWSSGNKTSPSLYLRQGNKLFRYNKNSFSHADEDDVFEAWIESGLIPFGESRLEWVHILKTIWQFDQAIGKVELKLNVHTKTGDLLKSFVVPFNDVIDIGMGGWDAIDEDGGAWDNRQWDKTYADFSMFVGPSDKKISQKVRKNAAYISFSIRSNTRDTYYELSHISMLFTYIGVGIEFLSQKGVIKI